MPKCKGCGIEKDFTETYGWESSDFCSASCAMQAACQARRDYWEAVSAINNE